MAMNQNNPVVWFEIYVQDMERAKEFYEAVLATRLEKMPAPTSEFGDMEMWAFPSDKETSPTTYGACGMLVKMGFMSFPVERARSRRREGRANG